MLEVKNLVKRYKISKGSHAKTVLALNNVSIKFPDKGLVFLLGKSGSGKSTLLNSIGGLDAFDSGEIIIKGKSSKDFSQSDFDSYRNTFIGFIFQEYNVLEEFTVAKNLSMALELQGKKSTKEEVDKLLEMVDMLNFANRKPNQLSGGQKQRVAIARALIKNPEIIMADEPTGALDSNTGKQVMDTLKKLSQEKLVIIVSHDREFAEIYGDRIVELKDGQIIRDVTKKEISPVKTDSGISVINNEIIHIKKGQRFTQEDVNTICKAIINNSQNGDTIISFSDKANDSVKKANAITDEGNTEVFKETSAEDIVAQNYDSKNFKLIKSKLKFSDSFKMGASALKSKIGKLIFTVFLSFIAFAMFGVIDTVASFDRPSAVAKTIATMDMKYVGLLKEEKGDYSYICEPFMAGDLEKIQNKFPDFAIKKILNTGIRFGEHYYNNNNNNIVIQDLESGSYTINSSVFVSGTACFTKEELDKEGFVVTGRLPINDNEICISKRHLDVLIKLNGDKGINEKTILEDPKNKCSINNEEYIIVGIVDDKVDYSEINNYSTEMLNSNYLLNMQISRELCFSTANLIYVSPNKYEELLNTPLNVRFNSYVGDTSIYTDMSNILNYGSNDIEKFYEERGYYSSIDEFVDGTFTYVRSDKKIWDGTKFLTLKDNEMILSKDMFSQIGTGQELNDMIENGLTIDFKDNSNKKVFSINVVGLTNYDSFYSKTFVENVYSKYTKGYDFVLAKMTDNNVKNNAFIEFCENSDNNSRYTVQLGATPVLDQFEDMFEDLSKIFFYIGIGFAVFASLLLMNFISTSISYKKREIGILRALGARGSDVFGIFFNESLIIAFINFFLASIATIATSILINLSVIKKLGFKLVLLNVGIRQILLILGVSILVAFISSLLPVIKIAKKKPIDAINNR